MADTNAYDWLLVVNKGLLQQGINTLLTLEATTKSSLILDIIL